MYLYLFEFTRKWRRTQIIYRALAFAQSNFPETLVNTLLYVSLSLCKWKKGQHRYISLLQYWFSIITEFHYHIFSFFAEMTLLWFFHREEKVPLKIISCSFIIYIKIEINIFAREHAFSIYKIFLRIGLSVPLFSSFTRKDTFAFRVHSRMQRE